MGMKMGSLDARHVIGDRCHTFDRLSCQAIYDCLIRLGRHIAIPFDKLSNDFIVDINHFIDDIPNQRAHREHPYDRERRGHHDLKVSLLRGGQRGCQCDELASHGPQRQQALHDRFEIGEKQMRFIHNNTMKFLQMVQCMCKFHKPQS
jgi:hypothetical protein